jgi:hypothetical protein
MSASACSRVPDIGADRARSVFGCLLGLLLLATGGVSPAPAQIVASDATVRDFMIQNVCLDAAGAVLIGISPIDGDPRCAGQSDLHPGERLPYHKDDQPAPADRTAAPLGYQRHDSFPVATSGLRTVVENSFDFGTGDDRRFGVFDADSDGGDIAVLSPGAASIGATRDAGGFKLWVGACDGPVTPAALRRSWLIAAFDRQHPTALSGHAIARLNAVPAAPTAMCPSRFNPAYTIWRVAPFRYRAAPGEGRPVTLTTLISEHYGGADPATADHVERFYFTRELGGSRWERWQNAAGDGRVSAAWVARQAAWFAATGRCSRAPPPAGARMRLIDCREWTRIAPPADPAGDPPGFFIEALRRRPDIPAFFAAPNGHH